ncbi:MAG: dockerin type I domain-containing protein, partial [Phycisphaerales bacterium]|nr:dockerin type I domain-containing protein [Phycisphaerales bacterium]
QAERICKAASATANAEQNSIIAGAQLEGEGTSSSQASAMEQDVIHAISVSGYEVTFSVAGASRFTLNAGLDASGAAPVVLSQARVRLNAVGNQAAIFEHISTPGPGGEPNPIVVEDSGELPAGQYTFRADANTVIDSTTPPNGNGNAYFQFVFGVVRIGDVNGDGQVNIDDLLALISAWGECPQPPADCPADLNHDGMVNVHDLLTVINHWG